MWTRVAEVPAYRIIAPTIKPENEKENWFLIKIPYKNKYLNTLDQCLKN